MMLGEPSDENPRPADMLFGAAPTLPPVADRHFYVDDAKAPGYCAACSLPASNRRRHVARRAA